MTRIRSGVRKLCVAYHVENHSSHGSYRGFSIRARLAELLDTAFTEAGLVGGDCQLQGHGDGGLMLLPIGGEIPEPHMLTGLIRGFEIGLAVINKGMLPDSQIRLRVALHQGIVRRGPRGYVGPAVNQVFRLLKADVVKSALTTWDGFLVVGVTDDLYQDVLARAYHDLPASTFRQAAIRPKRFHGTAWIYLGASQTATRTVTPADTADEHGTDRDGDAVVQHNASSGHGLMVAAVGGSVFIGAKSSIVKEARMPIEEEIAALAATGAAAVVTAIGTDAWRTVRDRIVRLYRMARSQQDEDVPGQLDQDASFVSSAADGPKARAAVRQMWEARLAELLAAAPECAAELRTLAAPGDQPSLRVEQRNSAHDSSTVAAAVLGNVYYLHQDAASAVPPLHRSPQDGSEQ